MCGLSTLQGVLNGAVLLGRSALVHREGSFVVARTKPIFYQQEVVALSEEF